MHGGCKEPGCRLLEVKDGILLTSRPQPHQGVSGLMLN